MADEYFNFDYATRGKQTKQPVDCSIYPFCEYPADQESQMRHIENLYHVHCDECGTEYEIPGIVPTSCLNCSSNAVVVRQDQELVDAIVAEKLAIEDSEKELVIGL